MQGGTAFAELLFGDLNPSGKLTISFPLHVGQQPAFYNPVRNQHGTNTPICPQVRASPSVTG